MPNTLQFSCTGYNSVMSFSPYVILPKLVIITFVQRALDTPDTICFHFNC